MMEAPAETSAVIELHDVIKKYQDVEAVSGISFAIERGEFLAIIGPSGCGKTTTLRMLAGLEKPTSGSILMDGQEVNELKPWKREVPLVWQNFALFPHLSVIKNVEFGLRMHRVPRAERNERAKKALQMVGLEGYEDRAVNQLSGGQKQRVGIARAMVLQPDVLLLDEPMGALDAKIARSMQAELRRLQSDLGITFVYVTHNQSEALAMADRIIVMDQGRVQQCGNPSEVYRKPLNAFVASFVGTNNILSGTVRDVGAEVATVETSEGEFELAHPPDRRLQAGESVAFAVSADRAKLRPLETTGKNVVEGKVTALEIIGAVGTIYMKLESGYEFRLQAGETEMQLVPFDIGDRVKASWEASSAHVLSES